MKHTMADGLRIGRLFESECARQMHIVGMHVSRTCDQLGVNGVKAPMLTGPFAGYRLPDLDVMGNGDSFWVDAKYKSTPTKHGLSGNEDQHGIDWPNWCDYLQVSRISGRRGFIIIGEGNTGEILIASFARLTEVARHYDGHVHFSQGAAFWPRWAFKPFGNFSPQTGQMLFSFRPLRPIVSLEVFSKGAA